MVDRKSTSSTVRREQLDASDIGSLADCNCASTARPTFFRVSRTRGNGAEFFVGFAFFIGFALERLAFARVSMVWHGPGRCGVFAARAAGKPICVTAIGEAIAIVLAYHPLAHIVQRNQPRLERRLSYSKSFKHTGVVVMLRRVAQSAGGICCAGRDGRSRCQFKQPLRKTKADVVKTKRPAKEDQLRNAIRSWQIWLRSKPWRSRNQQVRDDSRPARRGQELANQMVENIPSS